jgi:ribosomal protein L20A (L18A)
MIDVVAEDKEGATEYIYSNFGSKHRVPRRFVIISSIAEIDPSESTEPRVISAFRE